MLGKASEHRWLLVAAVARPPEETRGQELVVWAHGHTESRFGDQRGGERCGKGLGPRARASATLLTHLLEGAAVSMHRLFGLVVVGFFRGLLSPSSPPHPGFALSLLLLFTLRTEILISSPNPNPGPQKTNPCTSRAGRAGRTRSSAAVLGPTRNKWCGTRSSSLVLTQLPPAPDPKQHLSVLQASRSTRTCSASW